MIRLSTAEFQSTLPVWGATIFNQIRRNLKYFNPRSPCGERLPSFTSQGFTNPFQSTLPVWGATVGTYAEVNRSTISIHAPRVGSDSGGPENIRDGEYFNPRSPCGERPRQDCRNYRICVFQSTLPVWGATNARTDKIVLYIISIHAPRVGSDASMHSLATVFRSFQSTLPVWGATLPL